MTRALGKQGTYDLLRHIVKTLPLFMHTFNTKHLISQKQRFKGIFVVFRYAEAQNCHLEELILCLVKDFIFEGVIAQRRVP